MVNRVWILSLVAVLSVFVCGERFSVDRTASAAEPFTPRSVEMTISDADIPNPTSLMSGEESTSSITSSRRALQRNGSKRTYTTNISTRVSVATTIASHLHNTIRPNILGGVVADEAFYSLCCLRI